MAALGVSESDLEESFVRSGGHGGQNVNKVATCVLLLHRPSGLQIKCQDTRHQGQNRVIARARLLDKIKSLRDASRTAEIQAREKARRQKRTPSAGAKRRVLADKAHVGAKKRLRRLRDWD